jgi:Fe-S cluster assembly protein SufD
VNDNYSFIQHVKPSSSSREVFKSIVNNGAITNFQGKIYVDSIAQKTDGYQMSRSLLLDNISKANNKPELEIYADDVKCSHGSTVSKIDQEQIFYFNSRGISKEVANLLLQKAFIIETLDTIQTKDIKDFSIKLLDNLLT